MTAHTDPAISTALICSVNIVCHNLSIPDTFSHLLPKFTPGFFQKEFPNIFKRTFLTPVTVNPKPQTSSVSTTIHSSIFYTGCHWLCCVSEHHSEFQLETSFIAKPLSICPILNKCTIHKGLSCVLLFSVAAKVLNCLFFFHLLFSVSHIDLSAGGFVMGVCAVL